MFDSGDSARSQDQRTQVAMSWAPGVVPTMEVTLGTDVIAVRVHPALSQEQVLACCDQLGETGAAISEAWRDFVGYDGPTASARRTSPSARSA